MKKINIIVVDDNPAFLKGIAHYIGREDKYKLIAQLNSGIGLLECKEAERAHIILLDIEMPQMNGFETAKKIIKQYPDLKVIAITMYQDKVYLKELVEAGFKGIINKINVPEAIFASIESAMANHFLIPDNMKF